MHTEHIQISELCVNIKKRMSLNLRGKKTTVLSAFRKTQQHASPYAQTHILCLVPTAPDTTCSPPEGLLSGWGKPQQQLHHTAHETHMKYRNISAKCIPAGWPNSFSQHRKTMKCAIQYSYNSQATTDRPIKAPSCHLQITLAAKSYRTTENSKKSGYSWAQNRHHAYSTSQTISWGFFFSCS